jgi:hypothetical protein
MKKNFYLRLTIAVAAFALAAWLVGPFVYVMDERPKTEEVELGYNATSLAKLTSGTSSPVWVAPTVANAGRVATSEFEVKLSHADDARMNIAYQASTTSGTLTWQQFYSFDGIEWYGEEASAVSGLTDTHASTTITHSWAPKSASKVKKSVPLTSVVAPYIKVVFDPTVASGSLYAEIIKQDN